MLRKLINKINESFGIAITPQPIKSVIIQCDQLNTLYSVNIPHLAKMFRIVSRGGHDVLYNIGAGTVQMSIGDVGINLLNNQNSAMIYLLDNANDLTFMLTRKSGTFNFINIQFY